MYSLSRLYKILGAATLAFVFAGVAQAKELERPRFYLPLSVTSIGEGAGVGTGLAYRFKSGVILQGQVFRFENRATTPGQLVNGTVRVGCRTYTAPAIAGPQMVGWQTGGMVTVMLPLGK